MNLDQEHFFYLNLLFHFFLENIFLLLEAKIGNHTSSFRRNQDQELLIPMDFKVWKQF